MKLAREAVNHAFVFGVDDFGHISRAESRFEDVEALEPAHQVEALDVELDEQIIAEPDQDVIFVEKHDLELDGLEDFLLSIEDKNEFIVEKSRGGLGAEVENLFFQAGVVFGVHVADPVDDANLKVRVQLFKLFGRRAPDALEQFGDGQNLLFGLRKAADVAADKGAGCVFFVGKVCLRKAIGLVLSVKKFLIHNKDIL